MAVVYKAFDTHLEAEVAVKLIQIDNLPRKAEERAIKRFEREAKAVARLDHPNIVRVTDYGEYAGCPYLVMPYLPGGTLKQYLKKHGRLHWQTASRVLQPIADALGYAHAMGIVHRDVKPSNILLTTSGEPMLTDFGVAKVLDEETTQDLTGTSSTVGTPEYMAPEQVMSKTVDHRADIYALGVVFYEMVVGRRPFEADTPMAVLVKHASAPLPRPKDLLPELPDRVERVLMKSLAKQPEDRFQDMGSFTSALKDLNPQRPAVVPKKPVSSTPPVRYDQKKRETLPSPRLKNFSTAPKKPVDAGSTKKYACTQRDNKTPLLVVWGIAFLVLIGLTGLASGWFGSHPTPQPTLMLLITENVEVTPTSTHAGSILKVTTKTNTPLGVTPTKTLTLTAANTQQIHTATRRALEPTFTPRPPTNTPMPPTAPPALPTNTPKLQTSTPEPPTKTPKPSNPPGPTNTPVPNTNTPAPIPTATPDIPEPTSRSTHNPKPTAMPNPTATP